MKLQEGCLEWSGSGDTWKVDFNPATRPVKTFFEESVTVAEMIWAQKEGELCLSYSGGLDSEYVLAVFRHLGMNITPVIMRTKYNHHETQYAFKYCQERNIKHRIIDLDYDDFIESGKFLEIATEYKLAAFQMPSNLWLLTQMDGTILSGNSPPHLTLKDNTWYVDEQEPVFVQPSFFEKNNLNGTPFFLSYTSEQYLAFLTDPIMKQLASSQIPGKTGSNSSKVHVYNNQPHFALEQRVKKHGYEIVEQSPIFQHPDIQLVNSWKDKWWGICEYEYFKFVEYMSWKQ